MAKQKNKIEQLRDTHQHLRAMDLGKVPPQALDLEDAVLGAALIEGVGRAVVMSMLKPEHFYRESNTLIMEAVVELHDNGKKVDMLTVAQKLRERGTLEQAGGQVVIARLTNRVASTAHVEEHCLIVIQQWIKREVIRISQMAIQGGFDETVDALELLNTLQMDLLKVGGVLNTRQARSVGETMGAVIEDALKDPGDFTLSGVDTGYVDLNSITGGWQRSNLIVLAARPGGGKSAFALNFAWRTAAMAKEPTLFCSMEMSRVELERRLLAMVSTATNHNISNRQINDWERKQIREYGYLAGPQGLWIDDTPALTPSILRSKIIFMRAHGGCGMVIVDYLQLMESGMGGSGMRIREQEVSSISRQLKMIAMEFNIPVIALSQLSREVEKRGGKKKPVLSDLRESGAIEQDANMVAFVYSPHDSGATREGGEDFDPRYFELLIQKHRNGPLGDVPFLFIKNCSRVLGTRESSKNIFHVDHDENPNETKQQPSNTDQF
jgi:replicative DNA helicase